MNFICVPRKSIKKIYDYLTANLESQHDEGNNVYTCYAEPEE